MAYGKSYLRIMMVEMLPFCIVQVYAGSLREMGKTVLEVRGMATVRQMSNIDL